MDGTCKNRSQQQSLMCRPSNKWSGYWQPCMICLPWRCVHALLMMVFGSYVCKHSKATRLFASDCEPIPRQLVLTCWRHAEPKATPSLRRKSVGAGQPHTADHEHHTENKEYRTGGAPEPAHQRAPGLLEGHDAGARWGSGFIRASNRNQVTLEQVWGENKDLGRNAVCKDIGLHEGQEALRTPCL